MDGVVMVGEGVMAGWMGFSSFGGGLLAGMGAMVVRFGLEAEEGTGEAISSRGLASWLCGCLRG